ncbi:MAG: MBL fold metallo-hydrolase, partial [Ignavibacteriales bacterium]
MPLTVHQFPCLSDNYGFLIRDEASGLAACIDTPDAGAILRELKSLGWELALILNTHWHPDHAGGNAEVKAATGATVVGPKEVERIAAPDRVVIEGDVVMASATFMPGLPSRGCRYWLIRSISTMALVTTMPTSISMPM